MATPERLTAAGRHRAPEPVTRRRSGRPGHGGRPAVVLAAAGVLCVLGGTGMLVTGPRADVTEIGAVTSAEVGSGIAVVDGVSAPPPDVPVPVVAAGTVPVQLRLPGRGVEAPVVAVPTDPTGALVVPDAPSTVGWWSPSALAGGAAGTTVLAGHVDTAAAGLGALAVLRHVAAGEELRLRGADGREIGYRVTSRRQYAKAELPPEVFASAGPPRLVLITCGGAFDRTTRHYADNVVVFAEPV